MTLATFLPETLEDYERTAREYEASLTLEDIMESTRHARQRAITLQSLEVLQRFIRELEICNELLIQFIHDGQLVQVVPDNMFLLTEHPKERSSFILKFEEVRPFMTMEYVSPDSAIKDYEINMQKYFDLMVLYYLIFDPQTMELEIHRRQPYGYELLEPDRSGRVSIPELNLQIGLLDGWVRFWYAGELLPLSGELVAALEQEKAEKARLNEQNSRLNEQNSRLNKQNSRLARENSDLITFLTGMVEQSAKKAGRDDILSQLAQSPSAEQLKQWLTELS